MIEVFSSDESRESNNTSGQMVDRANKLAPIFSGLVARAGGTDDSGAFSLDGLPDRFVDVFVRGAINAALDSDRNTIIHHGVIRVEGVDHLKDIVSTIDKYGRSEAKFVSLHGNHVHVIHYCANSTGSCRCFRQFVPKRKSYERLQPREFSSEQWRVLLQYAYGEGRINVYYKIDGVGKTSHLLDKAYLLRFGEGASNQDRNEGDVATCCDEVRLLRPKFGCGDSSGDECHSSDGGGENHVSKSKRLKRKKEKDGFSLSLEFKKFIIQTSCAPLKNIFDCSTYYEHEFWSGFQESNNSLRHGLELAQKNVVHWDIKNFKAHYKSFLNKVYPVWSAYNARRFSNHYLDREESLELIHELFNHNYPDESAKYAHLTFLFNMLNRKTGKKNTLYVVSDPNAFKTTFFDAIADFFLSTGNMKNWNKLNAFPIEELYGARIAFWNEPSYDVGVEDELLKLLGGDRISANIKYKSAKMILTVPLVVTSNSYKFPSKQSFTERVTRWEWKPFPQGKFIGNRRLHPMAILDLILQCENYNEQEFI
jgi:hypothetical protein